MEASPASTSILIGIPTTLLLQPIQDQDQGQEDIESYLSIRPALMLCYPNPPLNPNPNAANNNDRDDSHHNDNSLGVEVGLALGRNFLTKIRDNKVSRKVATLQFLPPPQTHPRPSSRTQTHHHRHPRLVMKVNQMQIQHKLTLNGSRVIHEDNEINNGDEIGLLDDKYRYQVNLISAAASPAPKSTATSTASLKKRKQEDSNTETQTDRVGESARQEIIDEVTCPICMEIIVKAHAVNPCGHAFCKSCIDRMIPFRKKKNSSSTCPTCRGRVGGAPVPLKSLDNIIWNTILRGDIFGTDENTREDLEEYMQKCGRNISDLTSEQYARILQHTKKLKSTPNINHKIEMVDETTYPLQATSVAHDANGLTLRQQQRRQRRRRQREQQEPLTSGSVADPICL